MSNPEGIDISHNNGTIDWAKVAASGISFAFVKASEGGGFVDESYYLNKAQAELHGILVAPYHFFRWDVAPDVQANHFANVIRGRLQPGTLQPAIDIERPTDGAGARGYGYAESKRRIGIMLETVKSLTGRDPVIYTYPYAWATMTGDTNQWAASYPLWLASYRTVPTLCGGWPTFTFHQYTSTGHVDGVSGSVDRDRFHGDLAHLRRFAGLP